MDKDNQFYSLYERLIVKYDIDSKESIEVIDIAKNIYMSLRRVYDIERYTAYEISWVKRACFEICERIQSGMISGIAEYSENGYSYTVNGSIISEGLAKEILPRVGVIRYDS